MDDPISARYRLDGEEVVEANRIARWANRVQAIPSRWLRWCVGVFVRFLGMCWVFFGVIGLIPGNGIVRLEESSPLLIVLGLGVLTLVWPFFRDKTCRWLVLRSFRKLPERETTIEWLISDEDLSVQSSLADSRFRWELVEKVVDASNGFLIYTNKLTAHWIPVHAFDAKDGADRFQKLARSRVSNYVVLSAGRRALAKDLPKILLDEI
ncbi:MAG: YcxB family protein [Isosphaeraceae bacterium]